MNSVDKIESVLSNFVTGKIPVDELLLHAEPILAESALTRAGENEVRRIVNAIERAIFTQDEPKRTNAIIELLGVAVSFVRDQHAA